MKNAVSAMVFLLFCIQANAQEIIHIEGTLELAGEGMIIKGEILGEHPQVTNEVKASIRKYGAIFKAPDFNRGISNCSHGIYSVTVNTVLPNVTPNPEGRILWNDIRPGQINCSPEKARTDKRVKPEVLAQLNQAPWQIRSLIVKVVEENCGGSAEPSESRTLVNLSALERAANLGISLEDAIKLNTFLLNNVPKKPCSPTLVSPAIERRNQQQAKPEITKAIT